MSTEAMKNIFSFYESPDKNTLVYSNVEMKNTKVYQGTGLGLYVCKQIVDAYKGQI